jgi:hypothetical protein
MPSIDKHWLSRWKRDKGVVLRRPNMRFKCGHEALTRRLRASWVNCFKIRRLVELTLGHDLADAIFGFDEKPMRFNESGSKGCRTLELAGAPAVKLQENRAATRERVLVMTRVSSSAVARGQALGLPIEVLFKAKSARRANKLHLLGGVQVSVHWAEKGSYRSERVARYLRRWLSPWNPPARPRATTGF